MILTLSLRPDVTVVAAIVPDDSHSYEVYDNNVIGGRCIMYLRGKPDYACEYTPNLPPGQYEIVGLLSSITEEQAAGLVAWEFDTCRDYTSPGEAGSYVLTNPRDSLKSAIKANGGDPEQNWLLIKKIQ